MAGTKTLRRFLNQDFNPTSKDEVEKVYTQLLKEEPTSVKELETWIYNWEELTGSIDNAYSRAQVATTINTTDENAEKTYMQIIEHVIPVTEKFEFELNKKLVANPKSKELSPFYDCFIREVKNSIDLFQEKNIPLNIQEKKLINEYEKITGSMMAKFRGKELTMQQVARYLEDKDRNTRKEAYDARVTAKRKAIQELDNLYDKMLELRQRIAKNAGFKNFRDYQFKAYNRFDYSPEDCFEFHESIEKLIVPIVSKFNTERQKKLGVKELYPWDTLVNPDSKKSIEPFKTVDKLVSGCQKIFHQVDPELGKFFDVMMKNELLDLDSRKGKAPGGYCTQFSEEQLPFIFMNAAGTKRDVETLLHEGGHAFHYFLALNQPLRNYHNVGLEFAEVASMSMELLSRPYLTEFYSQEELQTVFNEQLRKILEFFPFMAMIDAFQHWVYTTDNPDAGNRKAKWAELQNRFQPEITWTGFEDIRDTGWQYPHVFSVPFYYVEYGIAQLGALAIWRRSLTSYPEAIKMYKEGLKMGGSKPLPELFSSVGAEFGMNQKVIKPLVQTLEAALN